MDKVSPVQFQDGTVTGVKEFDADCIRISGKAPWGEFVSFEMTLDDAKDLHKWFDRLWPKKKKKS